jgi:hypothetical protein
VLPVDPPAAPPAPLTDPKFRATTTISPSPSLMPPTWEPRPFEIPFVRARCTVRTYFSGQNAYSVEYRKSLGPGSVALSPREFAPVPREFGTGAMPIWRRTYVYTYVSYTYVHTYVSYTHIHHTRTIHTVARVSTHTQANTYHVNWLGSGALDWD